MHLGVQDAFANLRLSRDLEHEVVGAQDLLALACLRPVVLALSPCVQLGRRQEVQATLLVAELGLESIRGLVGGDGASSVRFQAIADAFGGGVRVQDGAVPEDVGSLAGGEHPIVAGLDEVAFARGTGTANEDQACGRDFVHAVRLMSERGGRGLHEAHVGIDHGEQSFSGQASSLGHRLHCGSKWSGHHAAQVQVQVCRQLTVCLRAVERCEQAVFHGAVDFVFVQVPLKNAVLEVELVQRRIGSSLLQEAQDVLHGVGQAPSGSALVL